MRLLIFSAVILFFVNISDAFLVSGRVTSTKELGGNVKVYFKSEDKTFETGIDSTGYFSTELKKGTYTVTAEGTVEGKIYKGFSGRNPLFVDKEQYIGIKLFPETVVKAKKIKSETVTLSGKLIYNNKPVPDGYVFLYMNEKEFKGMPYAYSLPTNSSGNFKIEGIMEGAYFVVAKKKDDKNPLGPVNEGDLIGFPFDKPYYFKSGFRYSFNVNMFKKVSDEIASVSERNEAYYLKGRVLDKNNNPVAGLYAFAYTKKVIGHERPVAISKRTDKNGNFILPLPGKGRYYIGVREFYGGTPVQGEYYGLYGETYDHHIDVEGDIENIVITVEKILK